MTEITETTPRRPRAEAERAERRRRDDMGIGRFRTLDVAGNKDQNFEYRWVNDEPGRMYQLCERDDWDPVATSELGTHTKDKGGGTVVERIVDKRTGKRAVLLRKLKTYYVADKAKEQAEIDELEEQIQRGATPRDTGEGLSGSTSYVPRGGIKISRRRT